MKLRRWHRLGIVITVLWVLLSGYHERSKHVDSATSHAVAMGRICLDSNQKPRSECFEEQGRILENALRPNWENVAFIAFVPVLVGWLLAFAGRRVFFWVRAGDVMDKPRLMKQKQTREFFGHHMLLHAAGLQLETAKQSEVSRFNNCLAAMTMTALAVEALFNAVGSRVAKDWSSFERLKPLEKLAELQRELGFAYEPTKSPWNTLHWLAGFRNDIAHAKPELVEEEKHFVEPAPTKLLFRTPPSSLEQEITVGNASRAFEAVQSLKGVLTDALPVGLRHGIYADAWSGSAEEAEAE